MSALDLINTRRMLNHAEKVARAAIDQCKIGSADEDNIEAMTRMYRSMGLDATVEQKTRTEERIECPPPFPPEADGSVQVGEGAERAVQTMEKVPIPGEYEITIRANQRATKIEIATSVVSIPDKSV